MGFPILYVEDDAGEREEMGRILKRHYADTHIAADGEEGWRIYRQTSPRVLIVDLKMPRMGGIELIEKIRAVDPGIYIVVTTAHSEKEDLISSIHLSVDRYLIKPINVHEVIERIDALENRTFRPSDPKSSVRLGEKCTYDPDKRVLYNDGLPCKMTKSETDILHLLVHHLNHPVSYRQFEHEIWNEMPMTKYALRTHIAQLRKKVCSDVVIENISGQGYLLKIET